MIWSANCRMPALVLSCSLSFCTMTWSTPQRSPCSSIVPIYAYGAHPVCYMTNVETDEGEMTLCVFPFYPNDIRHVGSDRL